jgi:hypothetical protein
MMHSLAFNIDQMINGPVPPDKPRRNGFCLMVFPLGSHMGCCNFISNANKSDLVALFKRQIARYEGQPEQQGHA